MGCGAQAWPSGKGGAEPRQGREPRACWGPQIRCAAPQAQVLRSLRSQSLQMPTRTMIYFQDKHRGCSSGLSNVSPNLCAEPQNVTSSE